MIWRFPEIGLPPVIILMFMGFSLRKTIQCHSASWGYPHHYRNPQITHWTSLEENQSIFVKNESLQIQILTDSGRVRTCSPKNGCAKQQRVHHIAGDVGLRKVAGKCRGESGNIIWKWILLLNCPWSSSITKATGRVAIHQYPYSSKRDFQTKLISMMWIPDGFARKITICPSILPVVSFHGHRLQVWHGCIEEFWSRICNVKSMYYPPVISYMACWTPVYRWFLPSNLHSHFNLPSGKLTQLWKVTTWIAKSTINGPCSSSQTVSLPEAIDGNQQGFSNDFNRWLRLSHPFPVRPKGAQGAAQTLPVTPRVRTKRATKKRRGRKVKLQTTWVWVLSQTTWCELWVIYGLWWM